MNPEMIEINYYPKPAKHHRTGPSIFKINKGYALIMSKKMIRHFSKCQILSIKIDNTVYTNISVKQILVGGE